jgi:hypothetical protein
LQNQQAEEQSMKDEETKPDSITFKCLQQSIAVSFFFISLDNCDIIADL